MGGSRLALVISLPSGLAGSILLAGEVEMEVACDRNQEQSVASVEGER